MKDVDRSIQLIKERAVVGARYPWMAALWSHCEMLAEMDPETVSAISLTTVLSGDTAEEEEAVCRAARLLADEFGFTQSVSVREGSASVRFARLDIEVPLRQTAQAS